MNTSMSVCVRVCMFSHQSKESSGVSGGVHYGAIVSGKERYEWWMRKGSRGEENVV